MFFKEMGFQVLKEKGDGDEITVAGLKLTSCQVVNTQSLKTVEVAGGQRRERTGGSLNVRKKDLGSYPCDSLLVTSQNCEGVCMHQALHTFIWFKL